MKLHSKLSDNFFVITGGPGAGKTTLLNELRKLGYFCIDESARDIIRNQIAVNGDALPWNNKQHFMELMFKYAVDTYKMAQQHKNPEVTFFDQGIIDVITYAYRNTIPITKEMEQAAQTFRYNKKVFVAPPWQEIYCSDTERKHTFEEAVEVFNKKVEIYKEYGYELLHLPQSSIQDRIDFILKHIR